jgi:hypothetical protein
MGINGKTLLSDIVASTRVRLIRLVFKAEPEFEPVSNETTKNQQMKQGYYAPLIHEHCMPQTTFLPKLTLFQSPSKLK